MPIGRPFIENIPLFMVCFHTTQGNQINMTWLATLISKIKQKATLWFSSTHKRKCSKLMGFFDKTKRRSSKDDRNNANQSEKKFTSNSKFKYNPNVTCHCCGRKWHIVPNYKDKTQDRVNGCSHPKLLLQFKVHRPLPLLKKVILQTSWLIDLFVLMDMSILTKGLKHVFFDQSTWL
jgi:hypothetical protein